MTATEIKSIENSSPAFHIEDGAGKAYQMVAQSVAIAIQDATDNLRNFNAINNTAVGVLMAEMIANPGESQLYNDMLEKINALSAQALGNYRAISESAVNILKAFPSAN